MTSNIIKKYFLFDRKYKYSYHAVPLEGKKNLLTSSSMITVFVHTNRNVVKPKLSHIDLVHDWCAPAKIPKLGARANSWSNLQIYKYECLVKYLKHTQKPLNHLWIMADTDTLFMCDGIEIMKRYNTIASRLVVSAEKQRINFHSALKLNNNAEPNTVNWDINKGPSQPNSGLLIGTVSAAFDLLARMKALKNDQGQFPCCPLMYPNGTLSANKCIVDDQYCLYTVLRYGTVKIPKPHFNFALDTNTILFGTISGDRDIRRVEYDSTQKKKFIQYAWNKTITTQPCIVHFAGMGKFSLPKLLLGKNMANLNWMPWNISGKRWVNYQKF